MPAYDPGRPCEILVEFKTTDGVDEWRNRHGVEVLEPRMIVSRADTGGRPGRLLLLEAWGNHGSAMSGG